MVYLSKRYAIAKVMRFAETTKPSGEKNHLSCAEDDFKTFCTIIL